MVIISSPIVMQQLSIVSNPHVSAWNNAIVVDPSSLIMVVLMSTPSSSTCCAMTLNLSVAALG